MSLTPTFICKGCGQRAETPHSPYKWIVTPEGDWWCWSCTSAKRPPVSSFDTPPSILTEASTLIHGPRRDTYGPVEESFTKVATLWSTLKGVSFTAADVAIFMMAFKLARESNHHQRDNLVDLCGYAALAQQIHESGAACATAAAPAPSTNP